MSGFDHEVITTHDERYRIVEDPAMRRVELRVIGCDYGATSYTTRPQADRMAAELGLSTGDLFLDVGSGAGWPALHIAASTGARAVLTDIPRHGLAVASRRIERDRADARIVTASGHALPFADETFDAVCSSDVLCCVPDKHRVLAESRRVLRRGGGMCFAVIAVPDGLDRAAHADAVDNGPPHVEAGPGYPALLSAAGFTDIAVSDVSEEFLGTSMAWAREWDAEREALRPLVGPDVYAERQATRKRANRAIADGLLQRLLVSARRP
jgi:SAM-dependent methyltransferase